MDNANSQDYLEKIKIQVIENLKRTTFAPSVQMTDVPRDPEGMNDEAEAELDDADEDENPDSRYTKRGWDKYMERDDELDPSDDEDENENNGVRRQPNAPKRRRNMMDYQNPLAVPDDGAVSARSGRSPAGSANGVGSHTASDDGQEGSPLSDESEGGTFNGAREDSMSSGNRDMDDDDVDMADAPAGGHLAAEGPQEATPPDSPPAVPTNSNVPAQDSSNDMVDEGDSAENPEGVTESHDNGQVAIVGEDGAEVEHA